MAAASTSTQIPPPTSFPPSVFASLNPALYLAQHLALTPPSRPSARSPSAFPKPTLHASAPLTHAFGSCVARAGDTAAVAGVRAEILDARDIPTEATRKPGETDSEVIDRLKLLVPNVEVATGASRKYLPGSAPGTTAQSAAWRVKELLVGLDMISLDQLEIRAKDETADEDEMRDEGESEEKVVGYWVLYIDITLISHAGSILPVIWSATLAALRTTHLPVAAYSTQHDTIICSSQLPPVSLKISGTPLISTFRVFEPSIHKGLAGKGDSESKACILADPDDFEEEVCGENIMVVVDCSDPKKEPRIRRIEKSGGGFIDGGKMISEVLKLAVKRWGEWNAVLDDIDDE